MRSHITNNIIIKVAIIPQISVNMDLFPLPDIRYVFGLILISLYLFFLLMFFLSRNLKMNDCIVTYIAIERLVFSLYCSGMQCRRSDSLCGAQLA